MNFSLEPTAALFETTLGATKDELRQFALGDVKNNVIMEASDHKLDISFDTPEGDDILIKKLDPENALGYRTFDSEDAFYQQQAAENYIPSARELGLDG